LRRVFDFIGIEATNYDFGAARNLPVRGSSSLKAQGKAVHWRPVEKSASFDPMSRWKNWSRAKHERFNWIAGTAMAHFGYNTEKLGGIRPFWNTWNWLLDRVERLRLFRKTLGNLKSVRLITDLTQRKMRRTGVQVDVVVRMANERSSACGILLAFFKRSTSINHAAWIQGLHASTAHTALPAHSAFWSLPIALLFAGYPTMVGLARGTKSLRLIVSANTYTFVVRHLNGDSSEWAFGWRCIEAFGSSRNA